VGMALDYENNLFNFKKIVIEKKNGTGRMVRFEVLAAVLTKFEAIWYMVSSQLVHNY
jgi:hypothetical protein